MGAEQDRLRKLKDIQEALDTARAGEGSGDGDTLTLRPPDIPGEGSAEGPQFGPWAGVAAEECPSCGQPLAVAGTPCPRCGVARRRSPAAAGSQTRVLLKGEHRGPPWMVSLSAALSPLAEIEPAVLTGAFVILLVLCGAGAVIANHCLNFDLFAQREAGVFVRGVFIVIPFVLPLLRLAAEVVWRLTVIPGLSVALTRLAWSPQRQRAQLDLEIKADCRLRERWPECLRAAFGVIEAPAAPLSLSIETLPLPGGSQVDLAALFLVRHKELDSALVILHLRDGRDVSLDARDLHFRAARCRRCGGAAPECSLCDGTGTVQSAVL